MCRVLVGATPSGLLSFVSPAYGGSTSDKQIVERSGLQSLCESGDSILIWRFVVLDMFAPFNVQVKIPTFFRNKNQMQKSNVILHDRKVLKQ